MSQSYLESEAASEATEDQQPDQIPEPEQLFEETEALALSVDDFSALEERILRAVELVKRERVARAAAEQRAARAEAQLQEQQPRLEQFESELKALRTERDHVRQRVERLLAQLDALEL